MAIWGRVMNAFEGAIAGWNNNPNNLVPRRDYPYKEDNAQRIAYYRLSESYLYNTIYTDLDALALAVRVDQRLYKFIRAIFNPLQVFLFLLASYTYKGTINTQELKNGAIPLRYENNALEAPLKQVIKSSNLDPQLGRYVKDAALLGDAAWWVVDDPMRRRVRLELIDPGRIKHRELDEVGNYKMAVIEYRRNEELDASQYKLSSINGAFTTQSKKQYTYTLVVDKGSFRTYKDGKPFPFHADADGKLLDGWDNPYGFVPLKSAYYELSRDGWGQNAFFGIARRQLDELNDQSSIIHDSIRNVVVPKLKARGMQPNQRVTVERNEKDSMTVVYLPSETADLEAIDIPLDISSATANRATMINELEKNLPVLALQRIREIGGNLSGVAIQNMFADATSCVENTRRNLDPALASVLQMAVSIGGIQGYDGFQAFNEQSYDKGDMELNISERAVIEDRLSRAEKVDKIVSVAKLPEGSKRKALSEMGYDLTDINEIVSADKSEQEQAARNAMRGFADSVFGGETDDEEIENADPEAENEEDARSAVVPDAA